MNDWWFDPRAQVKAVKAVKARAGTGRLVTGGGKNQAAKLVESSEDTDESIL